MLSPNTSLNHEQPSHIPMRFLSYPLQARNLLSWPKTLLPFLPLLLTDNQSHLSTIWGLKFQSMGNGEKHLLNFHLHLPHLLHHHQHNRKEARDIPKGCLAILVGQGEEQQRFVVPVMYLNHPLFMQLLKEAENEYGFDQKGTINIPCHVEEFRYVQGIIDREKAHHHHQHHHLGCFSF